ncbi:MAG: DUF3159 domain-containing protein [Actinobacteria bacterium]|nr:DUF3159 domain-containing protein [Actinomycetota bacterium]
MSEPKDESVFEHIEESAEQLEREVQADTAILAKAIGGWRGAIDSGTPSIIFLAVYFLNERDLHTAIYSALAAGILLAVVALVQRKSLQQVVSGLFGLAISAYLTARTGKAEAFFLPGIIKNAAYGSIFTISIWVKRPVLGYFIALLRKSEDFKVVTQVEQNNLKVTEVTWRDNPELMRKYSSVTWVWALMFLGRVLIMLPLYLAGATGTLGVVSVILGYPLFALVIYASYAILRTKSNN